MPPTTTLALLPSWLDAQQILHTLGPYALVGVLLIIFAECGLLVGFFLPGDSLLFTAGLLVATGSIGAPLWLVCVLVAIAATVGNLVGYGIGFRAGPRVFGRPDSRLFKREYVDKTQDFFDKYGARAIVLARFVPIVRTFITVTAGVAKMDFRRYATYTSVGAVIWGAGVTVLGFFLGRIEVIRSNIELMLVAVVLVSVVPIGLEFLRMRAAHRSRQPATPTPEAEPETPQADRHS
ncbi:DedA family protein [Actinopolymorpha singaporensis]|uniref:Membrane-associated protein n=1 Tax=Actinopolymorpha singaporensis TaxID=117157 RepID=A0A1H1LU57_9ACTN|nr:VTT domain-containing protein [Actinopolymorpha singaporensis]SDR78168.1 membrane-associated protein [Actinopolymorpha singaporensis]